MVDPIEQQLRALRSQLPEPRLNLTEDQKDELVAALGGPRTATSILKAEKDYPRERIPFLFNSIDPQLVLDILHNDMQAAIARALARGKTPKSPNRPR
jgi:hypothetical protein